MEATVVRGRCLPYGEGITYWPVVEVLKQLDVLPTDEAAALAIRSLLGESDAPTSAEEIAWAFRKTLEHAAAGRPLVVVFDDIQWGEETFRDLIEHVALLSSGAAILLLCLARPELIERRPGWPVTLRLEPLGDEDVEELMAERIPARAARQGSLTRQAATRSSSRRCWRWPRRRPVRWWCRPPCMPCWRRASISSTRPSGACSSAVRSRARSFTGVPSKRSSPEETQVTPRLAALVRKELVRPDRGQLLGEDGFRFRHLLIRDAAYEAMPKAMRADLHQRFATWLEEHGAELVDLDEIVGYHLEQANRYRTELGAPDDPQLAAAARRRLTAGGHARQLRADYGAAVSLYERAAALVPATEIDLTLETELGDALFGPEGRRRPAACRIPRASGPRRRAIVSANCAGGSGRPCSAYSSSRRARPRS